MAHLGFWDRAPDFTRIALLALIMFPCEIVFEKTAFLPTRYLVLSKWESEVQDSKWIYWHSLLETGSYICVIWLEGHWVCCPRYGGWTVNYSYLKPFWFYNCLWQSHYILSLIQLKLKSTYAHTVICFLSHLIYKLGLYILRAKDVDIDLRHKWWGCLLFSFFSEETDQVRVRSKNGVYKI